MAGEPIEVRFDIWCDQCKHKELGEVKDPCNECLATPANTDSERPIFFEKKE